MVAPPESLLSMASRSRTAPQTDNFSDRRVAVAVASIAGVWIVLTAGAIASCLALGLRPPPPEVGPPFAALAMPIHLARAWGREMPSPAAYWGTTLTIAGAAGLLAVLGRRRFAGGEAAPGTFLGAASRGEAKRAAGGARLLARHQALRPSLRKPEIADLGFRLGRSHGVMCHSSVEDSVVVLGPPRSGKGLHLAVPLILDAPGAVVTTSTRPDNLAITMRARLRRGPIAVFDPQRLAPEVSATTRWSPVRGCENPHTAMVRAKALTAGAASGTTDSTFWQASAEQAVRCLLHAAALGGCTTADLYRWSLSAVQAREAVMVLASHEAAAPGWQHALDALISTDPKQRDSVWAMVTIAFGALSDPTVLDALSPSPLDAFDPEMFLSHSGTVYVLGTSSGAAATSGLVAAFVEDVLEVARRMAAASPAARLDPPLTLILDEAANYPLPSLPSLMSDGGGSGMCPVVVLQSLAQARTVWGEHAAAAIWDAAIVKVILGGGSHARDLDDLSTLIGQRVETVTSTTRSRDGHATTNTSTSQVPILPPSKLRTLPFGTAVLLLRAAPPIALALQPWTRRMDAAQLRSDRDVTESRLRRTAASAPPAAGTGHD